MTIQQHILNLLKDSRLIIIQYQEQLLGIQKDYTLANDEEVLFLDQMVEDINFIVGTIIINCIQLEHILSDIDKNFLYYSTHQSHIDSLVKRITQFNQKIESNHLPIIR